MQAYCIDTNTWSNGPNMLVVRQGHCSCTLGNYIYVFGDFNTVERVQLSVKIAAGTGVKSPEWNSGGWQKILNEA